MSISPTASSLHILIAGMLGGELDQQLLPADPRDHIHAIYRDPSNE